MQQSILTADDIMLNDIIFTEVKNAAPRDDAIAIYNRVAKIWNIESDEYCIKALRMIKNNMMIMQQLKT